MRDRKVMIFFLILVSVAANIQAEKKDMDIDARFVLEAGCELEDVDYYDIEAEIAFSFEVTKEVLLKLELEADKFEVESEEISLRWSALEFMWIKAGQFEPELMLDEVIGRRSRLFSTKTAVADYADASGYSINNLGVKIYRNYVKDTFPFSYAFHVAFNTAHFESQFIGAFFYHFD